MASPFSIFRRNQATLLAVFGVALMVAFVILPAVIQMQQMGGGGGNYSSDAVLAWTGGEVTKTDLSNRQSQRHLAAQFVSKLRAAAQARPGGKDMNLRREEGMLTRLGNENAMTAVETMLLAQKGRDMGMSINDAAVTSFLHRVTDKSYLTDEDLHAAMAAVVGKGTTLPAIYHVLKEELLAYNAMQLALKGFVPTSRSELNFVATTPSEAWEYYNRMNRLVMAEFVPIAVEDYVDKVDAPSPKEVREFYEKHKDEYDIPGAAEPGFRIPQRADFHYIVADDAVYLKEEKAKVTRKEIEDYYEENKESFVISEDPFPFDEIDPNDPRQAIPRPPTVEETTDGVVDETTGEETPENGDANDGDADSEATEAPGQACDDDDAPPASEAPTDTPETPTLPEPLSDGDEAPPAEEPAPPEVPVSEKPAEEDPSVEDATSNESGNDTDDDGTTFGDDLIVPKKYKPLEDVEDQIRSNIASRRAQIRQDAAIERVRAAIEKQFKKVILSEDSGEFDGAALADEPALKFVKTGLIDMYSLEEQQKKFEIATSFKLDRQGLHEFHQLAYDGGLQEYQPIETQLFGQGGGGKKFVAWKVADQEPTIPELKGIEARVIEVWKLQAARELAKKAAEDIAADIDGDKPLKEQLGDERRVITPNPFSYYQGRSLQPVAIGEGIEDQQSDVIRRVVVQMPVGDVRAIPNAAKDTFYVVRLAFQLNGGEQARRPFMQDIVDASFELNPSRENVLSMFEAIGREDGRQLSFQWYRQLYDEYEVKLLDPEYFQRGQ